jgi:hypothetical protein
MNQTYILFKVNSGFYHGLTYESDNIYQFTSDKIKMEDISWVKFVEHYSHDEAQQGTNYLKTISQLKFNGTF